MATSDQRPRMSNSTIRPITMRNAASDRRSVPNMRASTASTASSRDVVTAAGSDARLAVAMAGGSTSRAMTFFRSEEGTGSVGLIAGYMMPNAIAPRSTPSGLVAAREQAVKTGMLLVDDQV